MKAWKIRKFAGDVVWDLRNRGLLPLVALLVVAMVVVPVMISRQAKTASPAPAALGLASVSAPEAKSSVVAYQPGVRDYRKRLDELKAKDPFIQHFRSSTAAAALGSSASTSTSTTTTVSGGGGFGGTGGSTTNEVTTDDSSGHSAPAKTKVQTRYVSYRLDVSVGEIGQMKRHDNVLTLSFLPSNSAPVLIYLGVGGGGSKALFLISSDVTDASGEGACGGGNGCEVLVLKQGQSEDLAYAPDGKTYRVKVLDLKRIVSSTPPA